MTRAFPILLALVLGACGFTTTGDAIRTQAKQYGAQAMDEGLANSEWFMCEGASIGSVKRRYGSSKERAQAYRDLCPKPGAADILAVPN